MKFSFLHYILALIISFFYLLLASIIPNWRFLTFAIQAYSPKEFFLAVWYTLQTTIISQNILDFSLTLLSALFVGANTILLITAINNLKKNKKITFSVGGASLVSLIATGCSSCSLSLFSIFGLTGAVSFLPFHGLEIHILSVIFLFASFIYMLKNLQTSKYCKVKINNPIKNKQISK